jgi:hypothetical protein
MVMSLSRFSILSIYFVKHLEICFDVFIFLFCGGEDLSYTIFCWNINAKVRDEFNT